MTEIEKKFLIEYPDISILEAQTGVKIYRIWQTYLESEYGVQERVRKRRQDGMTQFFHTKKVFLTDMSRIEDERLICEAEYTELIKRIKKDTQTLEKTRYAIPFEGHIVEIDLYPFAGEWAVCEVELESEDEEFVLPNFIRVIKDITGDRAYSNETLSRKTK